LNNKSAERKRDIRTTVIIFKIVGIFARVFSQRGVSLI